MKLQTLKAKLEKILEYEDKKPKIYIEEDTSLTFSFNNGKEWNLPNTLIKLRPHQQRFHDAIFKEDKRFAFLAWSRRAGKEVSTWIAMIKYAMLHRCTCAIIYPDLKVGNRVIWEGNMSLGGTTIDFLDFLGPVVDRNRDVNNTLKRIDICNGSTIWVLGAENYDKLRGMNLKFVVFSEFAFCDPEAYRVIRPMLAENGGKLILQTTFDGKNHAYDLYEKMKDNENWFTSFETVETLVDENGDRYVPEEEIQMIRDEGIMSEHAIQREYYMSIIGDQEKYYFLETLTHMKERGAFCRDLFQPGVPLYTFWDIGKTVDSNFIIFIQFIDGVPCIVGCQETNGKSYEGDIELIDKWRIPRGIPIATHFLPHDGKNSEKMGSSGSQVIRPIDYIKNKIGQDAIAVDRPTSLALGVQMARNILHRCKIDEIQCERLIECLYNHAKEYDERRKVYLQTTKHDWTSHAVKSIQTLALAIDKELVTAYDRSIEIYYGEPK